jgi:ribosome-associated translation inhibitor RaiA
MNLDLQARSFRLTKALRHYIKQRLVIAIDAGGEDIRRINVRLSDINGPHGGIDKRCHLHLIVPHLPDIVIQETQQNMYSAIDRAIERARGVLVRKISRRRDRKRSASSLREYAALAGT